MSTSDADRDSRPDPFRSPDNEGRTTTAGVVAKLGIDRAIGFAVMARVWQLLTGPITQLLIVFCFSSVQQGYYYAFTNLLAMQIFVELGLHVVIINVASHEWAGLSFDGGLLSGNQTNLSRLVSLGRTALRWYLSASILFVLSVSASGLWFFGSISGAAALDWTAPWLALVVLTGLQLTVLPMTAILEGCDQLPTINRIRFWQSIAGSIVVWGCMLGGFGLWALSASAAVRLLGEIFLVGVRYREFFQPFRRPPESATIDWRHEVLPLQWRIAIQGAVLWLANHLAGLVLFKHHGPEVAGRFGMMLTVLVAMQAASLSWIETRRPQFGQLIAHADYGKLDEIFFRMSRISISLLLVATFAFSMGVGVVNFFPNWLFDRIADRLPSVWPVVAYSLAMVIMQFAQVTNIYVRAHKKDPFLLAAIVSNVSIACAVYICGIQFGIIGVCCGYLAGVTLIQVPWWIAIWSRTRRQWHQEAAV